MEADPKEKAAAAVFDNLTQLLRQDGVTLEDYCLEQPFYPLAPSDIGQDGWATPRPTGELIFTFRVRRA